MLRYLLSLYATYLTYSPYVISNEHFGHFTTAKSSDSFAAALQSGQTIFIQYIYMLTEINVNNLSVSNNYFDDKLKYKVSFEGPCIIYIYCRKVVMIILFYYLCHYTDNKG